MAWEELGKSSVTLSGRNVLKTNAHNALAITDISNHDVIVDTTTISGRKCIHVANNLNQPVIITIYSSRSTTDIYSAQIGSKTIDANSSYLITVADIAGLLEPSGSLLIRARCAVAPVSGSVSTTIEGVQA